MLRKVTLLFASLAIAQAHNIFSTQVTWYREISRVLYKRCATCHREGGAAFSLMTFDEARPWAKAIKEEVLSRRMPPWQAVKGFGEFKDDRGLTEEEIELISDWVEGGAPDGNEANKPADPKPAAWLDPAVPKGTTEVIVSANTKLDAPTRVVGVRPKNVKAGATFQMLAVRPDGTVEPLLWIYQYNPKFARTYYYKSAPSLPAGTRIEISPSSAGAISLFEKNAVSAKR
jgi:mono/diheme cytochrome c family protein